MHLWELKGVYFDYFFFDENCSYQLLSLLEAARPELRLRDRVPAWAIPSDTVRAVTRSPGLIKNVRYRPARGTILARRSRDTDNATVSTAREIADGERTPKNLDAWSPTNRATILELAHDYLLYNKQRGKTSPDVADPRLHQILIERSGIAETSSNSAIPQPKVRPDEGHGSNALAVGFGIDDNELFYEFLWRPVYHELLDPQPGFLSGSQVQLQTFRFRHQESESIRLEESVFVDVFSLTPANSFFTPISWRFNAALRRKRLRDNQRHLIFDLEGGAGLSLNIKNSILAYTLVEGSVEGDDDLEKKYGIGVGPRLGLLYDPLDSWRLSIFARQFSFFVGDTHSEEEAGLEQVFSITRDNAIRASVVRKREFSDYRTVGLVAWYYYF